MLMQIRDFYYTCIYVIKDSEADYFGVIPLGPYGVGRAVILLFKGRCFLHICKVSGADHFCAIPLGAYGVGRAVILFKDQCFLNITDNITKCH